MTDKPSSLGLDPLLREGADWLLRIRSGRFAASDWDALMRWRAQSEAHEAAFRRAEHLGLLLREAGRAYREQHPSAVIRLNAAKVQRRTMLTGALAASVAVAVLGISRLSADEADFETVKGERRKVHLANGLSLDLDAATRIAVKQNNGNFRVGLLDGRAEVAAKMTAGAVTVAIGRGRATARNARFNVELNGVQACVTCLEGQVQVAHPLRDVVLSASQQLRYTDDTITTPSKIDVQQSEAWKRGWLVFHHVPLEQVVREVNRYRPGRILLANSALGQRPVNAMFRSDRIEKAVGQIRQLTGARVTVLPGDVVVLT